MKPPRSKLVVPEGSDIVFVPSALGITTDPVRLLTPRRGWIGPIRLASSASADSGEAADTLAALLAEISGVAITVEEGSTGPGIYLGTYAELGTIAPAVANLESADDDYVLVSYKRSL